MTDSTKIDGGVLLNLPIRTRDSSAAMTPAQEQFFRDFPDYTIDSSVDTLENFKRLSGLRCWKVGAQAWIVNWRRCFGREYDDTQYPFHDEVLYSYFDKFEDYFTNPRLTMSQEFAHLASHMGWKKNSKEWKDEWRMLLHKVIAAHYGNSSALEGWQKLCLEVGEVPGKSITQCKKVSAFSQNFSTVHHLTSHHHQILKSVYVNLVDLMNCRRRWDNDHGPDDPIPEDGLPGLHKFPTFREFNRYTKSKGRTIPRQDAKTDGFTKALLRHLMRY